MCHLIFYNFDLFDAADLPVSNANNYNIPIRNHCPFCAYTWMQRERGVTRKLETTQKERDIRLIWKFCYAGHHSTLEIFISSVFSHRATGACIKRAKNFSIKSYSYLSVLLIKILSTLVFQNDNYILYYATSMSSMTRILLLLLFKKYITIH